MLGIIRCLLTLYNITSGSLIRNTNNTAIITDKTSECSTGSSFGFTESVTAVILHELFFTDLDHRAKSEKNKLVSIQYFVRYFRISEITSKMM